MDLYENAIILLRDVLRETENGLKIRQTTREAIKQTVAAADADRQFILEMSRGRGK